LKIDHVHSILAVTEMKNSFKEIPGSFVAQRLFLAGGVFCDIKKTRHGQRLEQRAKTRPRAHRFQNAPDRRRNVHDKPDLRRA